MTSPEGLKFFANFIERELGIIYSTENSFQLEARLLEVARSLGIPDTDALYSEAVRGMARPMKELILEVATNHETSFFRDPRVFSVIETRVLPELLQKFGTQEPLKIWSAACSYGQEPYSLAMLLSEAGRKLAMPRFEIIGTDVSEPALSRAGSAQYSELEVGRGLPPHFLSSYFERSENNKWRLNPQLRGTVSFQRQNLREPLGIKGPFHLILCRNVLIYQRSEARAEIVRRIISHLAPGGFLILGAGESLIGISEDLESDSSSGVVLYRPKVRLAAKTA